MKALVFGAAGLVGGYLPARMGSFEQVRVSLSAGGMDYNADASDFSRVKEIIAGERPDFVINLVKAGMSTDESERRKAETWKANVLVPENLARLQNEHGYRLVHVSSDWVYEGKEGEEYTEESLPYPQNFYSFSKAVAEERVSSLAEDYAILRPGSIFGMDRKGVNFFSRVMASAGKGLPTKAAVDQYSQPIFAGTLAGIIAECCSRGAQGVFNAVGKDYVSRYELACMFCDSFGWKKALVEGVHSGSRGMKVPAHLKLSTRKLEGQVATLPSLEEQISELRTEVVG